MRRVYVVRLGHMVESAGYIRERTGSDWIVTFDQRRAKRYTSYLDADLTAEAFGDARAVRLRTRDELSGISE